MKTLFAGVFAAALMTATAASAGIGLGVHVGGVGVGAHIGGHSHHHGCRSWGYRHHNRYCRGYW